jgi:hypothetical protein
LKRTKQQQQQQPNENMNAKKRLANAWNNWAQRGRFLISLLGANFDPQGWSWSQVVNFVL